MDDWDKLPSFDAGEAPRRSTSSLDPGGRTAFVLDTDTGRHRRLFSHWSDRSLDSIVVSCARERSLASVQGSRGTATWTLASCDCGSSSSVASLNRRRVGHPPPVWRPNRTRLDVVLLRLLFWTYRNSRAALL
jgi:hypothetical protein